MWDAKSFWLPFDSHETLSLFWVCTNAFNAYYHYRKFKCCDSVYGNLKRASLIEAINSKEYPNGKSHYIPYATITGEIKRLKEPLMSSDEKTAGVIRILQEYSEYVLYIPLLGKFCAKGKVSSTRDAIPFQVHNKGNGIDFSIEPPSSESLISVDQMLPVVFYSMVRKEGENMLNWMIEAIPNCRLLLYKVAKEKMLPIKESVTIMGKVLIDKDGYVSVVDPESVTAPFIISVLSPQEVLKIFRLQCNKELGVATYFASAAAGLTVILLIELYRQSKRRPRMFRYTKSLNLYLAFVSFTTCLPALVARYLF